MDFLTYLSQTLIFSAPIVFSLVLLMFSLFGGDAEIEADLDVDFDIFSLGQVPKTLLLALLLMFFGLVGAYVHFSGFLSLVWSSVVGIAAGILLVMVSAKRLSWLFRDWGAPQSLQTLMGTPVKIKRKYGTYTGQALVDKDDGHSMILNVKLDEETCGDVTIDSNTGFFIYGYDEKSHMYLISDALDFDDVTSINIK